MPRSNTCLAAIAAALLAATGTIAQQPGQLDHVAACRVDDETVSLRFTFEGGACQQPGDAVLEDAGGGVGNVTVPTEETAEVCTMQIVPVEFSGELPAGPDYTAFDIAVLGTDGAVQALGSAGILEDGPECAEMPSE